MTHLIHVGFPKTGSKYLQQWFQEHPQVLYKKNSLVGLQNVLELIWTASNNHPAPRTIVTSSELLTNPYSLDKSGGSQIPSNIVSSIRQGSPSVPMPERQHRCCQFLHDLFPTAKILLMTRGFRGMLRSHYSEQVRLGGLAFPAQYFAGDWIFEYLNYDYVIEQYCNAFGSENVLVLPYELLRDSPSQLKIIVEKWINVEHFSVDRDAVVNSKLSDDELLVYPFISRVVWFITQLLGFRLYSRIYRRYVRMIKYRGLLRIVATQLNRLMKRQYNDEFLPATFWQKLSNNASFVHSSPLYKPYLLEYLQPQNVELDV